MAVMKVPIFSTCCQDPSPFTMLAGADDKPEVQNVTNLRKAMLHFFSLLCVLSEEKHYNILLFFLFFF